MFTRTPPPTRPSGDRRRGLTYIFAGLAALYLVLTALGTLWTDFLWFDSVGYAGVWQRRWLVTIGLGVAGALVTFLVIWTTLIVADRVGPRYFPTDTTPEEELVVRFRMWVDGRVGLIRLLVAGGFALFVGIGVATWRDDLFRFLGRQEFGRADPFFGLDVGFYVFQFPLIDSALAWLFNLVAAATVVAVIAHYLNGGIRIQRGSMPTFAHGAKVHVSILLAVLALIRAGMYRMDALALLFSDRQSNFFGPGYTDITARLPALRLLMAIAVVTAVVLLVNLARRGWTLVVVAVGAWVLVSVAALLVYPAVVERLQVQPDPLARESTYIAHSIEFTRAAYGLDRVEIREFPASATLTAEDIEANRPTIDNLRLWDTAVLPRTYQNLQVIRPYYGLERVDTDRYELDGGVMTQTMVAVRELDESNIPRTDWQNTRLAYTHGIGAVISQANAVESNGQPNFLLADLPPVADDPALELTQPRIYFGESYAPGRPVIVRTGSGPQEVDLPLDGERIQPNQYEGSAGVELGSLWRRIAFAFRYRDLNLLISGQIRPDSRVLVQRNINAIVADIAPFLEVDSDPYPVVSEGRVVWVVDMYTSSGHFPYSQPITATARERLPLSTDLGVGLNYVASSVKATIDAYDGTVDFYVVDQADPVIRAWQEVYPGLFRDGSEMPEGIAGHLRYPQDLFRIQGETYLEYHVDVASEFFSGNDVWSIPPDPATIVRGQLPGAELLFGDRIQAQGVAHLPEMLPYYLLTRLPGEEQLSYVLLQPFNPRDKPNMSSFLAADAPTADTPGRLVDLRMPQGTLVGGTGQVGDRIQQNDEIAEQFTLWRGQGSDVIQGDLLVVPVEDSIMYVQPIYLQAQQGGFPEFRRVVVVFGDQIEWASTLDAAMAEIFDIEVSEPEGPGETPTDPGDPEVPSTVGQLLDEAAALLEQANQALQAGDLGEYQRLVDEAADVVESALSLTSPDVEAALP